MKRQLGTSLLAAAALLFTGPAIADQAAGDQQEQPTTQDPQPRQEPGTAPDPQPRQETDPTQSPTQDKTKAEKAEKARQKQARVDQKQLEKITSTWSAGPRSAIDDLTKQYGEPNEATPSMVIWRDQDKFKKIVVHRDAVQHNFPKPHQAFIKHVVEYKVPADKFDELAEYNGAITANRATGELSVLGEDERMNVLALNLANDIIEDDKDVEEARQQYARAAQDASAGKAPTVAQKLQFSPMANAADPGTAMELEDERRGVSQ